MWFRGTKTRLLLAGENMREEHRTAEKDNVVFAFSVSKGGLFMITRCVSRGNIPHIHSNKPTLTHQESVLADSRRITAFSLVSITRGGSILFASPPWSLLCIETTEYISLQEMKQGQCICPLSWSVHCNFIGDGKCNKRGRAPPTLTSQGKFYPHD
jgi:hypothetical protein